LMLACANKNEAAAALLMEATQKAGALDVQGGDKQSSALHYASVNGWESAVAKLLSLGADAALKTKTTVDCEMDKCVAQQYLRSVSADGLPLIGSTIFAGYGSAAGQVSDNDPKSLFGTKYDGVYFVKVLWNGDGEMRVKPDGISWNQQQVDAVQCITSRMADGSVRLRFTAPNGHEGRWESFDIKFEPNKSEFVGAFQRQGEGILTTRGRNNGDTALILACANKNEAAAALLMEATQKAGALDVQDRDQSSALHYASVNGLESAVAKLLSLGADAALKDKYRKTPVDCAKNDEIKAVFAKHAELLAAHAGTAELAR
jgi:ankyrin repeat protein